MTSQTKAAFEDHFSQCVSQRSDWPWEILRMRLDSSCVAGNHPYRDTLWTPSRHDMFQFKHRNKSRQTSKLRLRFDGLAQVCNESLWQQLSSKLLQRPKTIVTSTAFQEGEHAQKRHQCQGHFTQSPQWSVTSAHLKLLTPRCPSTRIRPGFPKTQIPERPARFAASRINFCFHGAVMWCMYLRLTVVEALRKTTIGYSLQKWCASYMYLKLRKLSKESKLT